MYALFTDTDTDITPEVAAHYGMKLISMPYEIDGKEVFPYVDFDKFEPRPFYDKLRSGVMPKTSALNPEIYKEYFEPCLKAGQDVLYVHFSSAMSGTFNALNIAVKELKEKYPENTVYTLDTKAITMGAYAIVREVGDLYLAGKTIPEILEWGKKEIDKFATFFFVEDLKFFKRSGRIKAVAAFMGNMIGLHPIIHIGKDGVMTLCDKAVGTKATLNKVISYMQDNQEDIKNHRITIGHTDAPVLAEKLAAKIKETFGNDVTIETVICNPTAGSHSGPDGVGVCFHAKSRLF